MVEVSVVIVNYNVRYFLETALYSVYRAVQGVDAEVIVVDNNSQDDSCDMVRTLFPNVKLIANTDNPGFGVANNQGISVAKGRFVLLLNPDTIITESTLTDCIAFMQNHADAGALGVHMINGDGVYLRESKRGLPTPAVSFYKMSGLINLFPRSKIFGQYYLGHMPEDEPVVSDILSGAFMFVRREAFDVAGLFDEEFFMYGEDIDLSYRFVKSGFTNYYLGRTPIIHFKGESTKKGSLNYVIVFYKAMEIFARKHFTGGGWSPYRLAIEGAIKLKTFLSILSRIFTPVTKLLSPQRINTVTFDALFIVSKADDVSLIALQYKGLCHNILHHQNDDFCKELEDSLVQSLYHDIVVVFDIANISLGNMVRCMELLRDKKVEYQFVTPFSRQIVKGSNV